MQNDDYLFKYMYLIGLRWQERSVAEFEADPNDKMSQWTWHLTTQYISDLVPLLSCWVFRFVLQPCWIVMVINVIFIVHSLACNSDWWNLIFPLTVSVIKRRIRRGFPLLLDYLHSLCLQPRALWKLTRFKAHAWGCPCFVFFWCYNGIVTWNLFPISVEGCFKKAKRRDTSYLTPYRCHISHNR